MANMFTFKIDTENSELTNQGTDIKITNWCGTWDLNPTKNREGRDQSDQLWAKNIKKCAQSKT